MSKAYELGLYEKNDGRRQRQQAMIMLKSVLMQQKKKSPGWIWTENHAWNL